MINAAPAIDRPHAVARGLRRRHRARLECRRESQEHRARHRASDGAGGHPSRALLEDLSYGALGEIEQDWFANSCIAVRTELSSQALLERCLGVEQMMKRVRIQRWGPRMIDVDVSSIATSVSMDPHLTLPHPRIMERGFVLVPLAEIAPGPDHRRANDRRTVWRRGPLRRGAVGVASHKATCREIVRIRGTEIRRMDSRGRLTSLHCDLT